jgi:hypothetical protein
MPRSRFRDWMFGLKKLRRAAGSPPRLILLAMVIVDGLLGATSLLVPGIGGRTGTGTWRRSISVD